MPTDTVRAPATLGRPRGGDPAKRRTILDAAIVTFLREGYERACVDTIAEAAGVAKQTVYNHFGDKEHLFLSAIEHERSRAATDFAAPAPTVDESGEPNRAPAALMAAAHRTLAALLDERATAMRRLIVSEVARHPELRGAGIDSEPPQLISHLADTLRTYSDRGELAVPEPRTAARMLVALLVQQGMHMSLYGTRALTPDEVRRICRQTVELFLRAYRR